MINNIMSDEEKDQFVIDVFKNMHTLSLSTDFAEKTRWFNNALQKLEKLGVEQLSYIPGQLLGNALKNRTLTLKINESKNNVINMGNFMIMYVNKLFNTSIINLYSDEALWSHKAVPYILINFERIRKLTLPKQNENYNVNYSSMKLFVNLVYNFICDQTLSNLKFNVSNVKENLQLEQGKIKKAIIEEQNLTNSFVCSDVDVLLFTNVERPFIFNKNGKYSSLVSYDSNVQELNRLCRKFRLKPLLEES